jgi:hypothetical protein
VNKEERAKEVDMTAVIDEKDTPVMVVEQVHLPDKPENDRYNAQGKKDKNGNVFIVTVGPTVHAWAVFEHNLRPRQSGTMIFDNVSGSGILDTIVSQWIKGGSGQLGENFNQPHVGEAVIAFLGRERAPGSVKVVGYNSSDATVSVAAALLYIPGTGG